MQVSSRQRLVIKILILVSVLVAGMSWFAISREVVLRIDGVAHTVHTHAPTVGMLLATRGHEPSKRDVVRPGPSSIIQNGLSVQWNRARKVVLTVDGKTRTLWATSRTVADLLKEADAPRKDVRLSASRDARIPLSGMKLRVGTRKTVTLTVAKEPREVTTYAGTVAELLRQESLTLDDDDRTIPKRATPLADGDEVVVQDITIREAVEEVTTPAPEEVSEDAELMEDQRKVVDPGADGLARETVEYIIADGDEIERKVISREVLTEAKPRVIHQGTKPYPKEMDDLNWAALAACESGGNPQIVSSNGLYHGLYQFNVSTWQGTGGTGLPSEATPEEQTYRAWILYQRRGVAPWPHCGPQLLT